MESTSRFDRFEILSPLGTGGMGEVVKARALGPHGFEKLVAIKRIRAEWAEQDSMAARFVREARIAARLQHANIVQVFDFGRHGDELFIVMELVDGQSLYDIVSTLAANAKRPTISQTLQIGLDIARALESAHGLRDENDRDIGIVHRDVSPANILISREGVVKLADFGIAAFSSHQARSSMVAGKPLYMAPEQLRGDNLDGRCDLFAVGMILYELMTGERPWKGMVDAAPDATLESMDYRPPSELATGIPEEVDVLVAKLLAPDREKRFANAGALSKAILKVSYASQIVLDSSELRELVGTKKADAHAETLPSHPSHVQTLVATGVSPDGATLLATDEPQSTPIAIIANRTVPEPTRAPRWVWGALLVAALGGGAAAWVFASGDEEDPIAGVHTDADHHQDPEPDPIPAHEHDPVADPDPDPDPIAETDPDPVSDPDPATRPPRAQGSAARSRPPPPVATGTGVLSVFCQPWALIYLDGVQREEHAPHRGFEVPAGRHVVRLVNPPSGLTAERTVTVTAGETTRLRVRLNEEPSE